MRKPTNSPPERLPKRTRVGETRVTLRASAKAGAFFVPYKGPGFDPRWIVRRKNGEILGLILGLKIARVRRSRISRAHEISRVRAVRQVLRGSTAQISPSDNPREAPPVRYLRTLTPAPRTVSVGRALEFRRLAKRLSTPRASRSCLRAPPRGRATRRRGERVARAHGKTGSRARLR